MKKFFLFSLLIVGLVAVRAAEMEDEEETDVQVVNKSSESNEDNTPYEVISQKVVKPWKKHDWKKREPEFLTRMAEDAKTEYFGIKFNPELTKALKQQKLKSWAEKYEVEEEMTKFLADKKADCDRKKQERNDNYEKLGEIIEKAEKILSDESNTWKGANEKLEDLVKNEEREVQKAFYIFFPFIGDSKDGGRHGKHGHRFHHGKRFSGRGRHARNIGHGAAPKHHGIGHGAEPPRPLDARESYDPYGNKHHHKHHGF